MTHQEKRVACFSYNLKREYIGRVFNPPLDLIGCFSDVWFSKLQSGNPNSSFFVKTKVFFPQKANSKYTAYQNKTKQKN
jgi:hypothetical protein